MSGGLRLDVTVDSCETEANTRAINQMALCALCRGLTIASLRHTEVLHQPDLISLRDSAVVDGCRLCGLFWKALQDQVISSDIERHLNRDFLENEGITDSSKKAIHLRGYIYDVYEPSAIPDGDTGPSSIYISSGPMAVDSSTVQHSKVYGKVNLHARHDDPAAAYLHERAFLGAWNKDLVTAWTRSRLQACIQHHPRCGGSRPQAMPTRVLDVGAQPIRLLETKRADALYMALSYNWGPGVKHEVVAKKATYGILRDSIDEARMTRSHREAVMVARALGYRYLWIDALCIIQDDEQDWAQESARMHEVYGNADLTLIAGRASDSRNGFLDNNLESGRWDVELEYSRHAPGLHGAGKCVAALPRSNSRGPVSQRAWCFQEDVLSTRQIIYMQEKIAFQCQECTWCEDGSRSAKVPKSEGRYILNQRLDTKDLLLRWYNMLQDYTGRNLYEPTDIFAALMGIARLVQDRLGGRYLAGIWEQDLIQGLLWLARNCVYANVPLVKRTFLRRPVREHNKPKERPAHPRAPSWSWAAVEGPVIASIVSGRRNLDMEFNRSLSNASIRPLHYYEDGKPRWTSSTDCSVAEAYMPSCTLEILGTVGRTRVSTKSPVVGTDIAKWPWRFRVGFKNKNSLLIKSSVVLTDVRDHDRVVALGIVDVPSEGPKPGDEVYCMEAILQQGLLLRKVDDNTYQRLGLFIVYSESFFEGLQQTEILLI